MKTNPTLSPETAAVLDNQAAIVTVNAAIKKLAKALDDCETQIEDHNAAMSDLIPLQSEREDLLAAVAIGEKKQSDVDKLDASIAKLRDQHKDAKPALDAINQTIGGLQRRMAEATANLTKLKADRAGILRSFLTSRAEALGAEYVQAAKLLESKYMQLLATSELLSKAGRTSPLKMHGEGLHIPNFDLESMAGAADRVFRNAIFHSKLNSFGDLKECINQETRSLLEQGIEL